MELLTLLAPAMLILLASARVWAGDGEGTAIIGPSDRLVAGSHATITVTFRVGPNGIPVGGGVALGLHMAESWADLQIDDPDTAGYIEVTGQTPDNFELEWHPGMAPPEAIPEPPDCVFRRVLFAKVKRAPLGPGQRVTIVLGANRKGALVPPHVEKTAEFHVMTDGDGDGVYKGIPRNRQPIIEIVPSQAHHLVASVPATIIAGQAFEMQIRAEDEFFNKATDYAGKVTVHDEDGSVVARNVDVSAGVTRLQLTATTTGPRRWRLRGEHLEGRSNPCRVFKEQPSYRIYWGDIHGHTALSDGLADTAREYFAFGRDVADLDVCAMADHGSAYWPELVDAVKRFYEPGRYVTILGHEEGNAEGHVNFYFRDEDEEHLSTWLPTYRGFIDHAVSQYGTDGRVITGPHHFASWPLAEGTDYPWDAFDERICRFVEVYSIHGASEYLGNPRPIYPQLPAASDERRYLQAGLAKGLRFGVIGSSDGHDSHPGRTICGPYPGGLVAFLATELTREAIWDAFWNRRVYATSFDRIYVEFTIDGRPMGSDLAVEGPCRVNCSVIGQTDEFDVFLIRNNREIRTDSASAGVVEVDMVEEAPRGENWYYLRVVQENGERAWSTPIWVKRE